MKAAITSTFCSYARGCHPVPLFLPSKIVSSVIAAATIISYKETEQGSQRWASKRNSELYHMHGSKASDVVIRFESFFSLSTASKTLKDNTTHKSINISSIMISVATRPVECCCRRHSPTLRRPSTKTDATPLRSGTALEVAGEQQNHATCGP